MRYIKTWRSQDAKMWSLQMSQKLSHISEHLHTLMFLLPFTPHVPVPFGRSETVKKKKRLFPTKHVKIYATRPNTASNNCGLQCLRLLFQRWGIPKRSSKLTPQLERGIPSWNHNFIELHRKRNPSITPSSHYFNPHHTYMFYAL